MILNLSGTNKHIPSTYNIDFHEVNMSLVSDSCHEMFIALSYCGRIAIMNGHYVGSILGIKGAVHKKKLAVKAMDIVMFGPPKRKSYLRLS